MIPKQQFGGSRNVRIPARVGPVSTVFVMNGQAFGFHSVIPQETLLGKRYQ